MKLTKPGIEMIKSVYVPTVPEKLYKMKFKTEQQNKIRKCLNLTAADIEMIKTLRGLTVPENSQNIKYKSQQQTKIQGCLKLIEPEIKMIKTPHVPIVREKWIYKK